jgi:hypothetical protein
MLGAAMVRAMHVDELNIFLFGGGPFEMAGEPTDQSKMREPMLERTDEVAALALEPGSRRLPVVALTVQDAWRTKSATRRLNSSACSS